MSIKPAGNRLEAPRDGERERLSRALEAARDEAAARAEAARVLSHDLRNHIATIGLMSATVERLLTREGNSHDVLRHLALINSVVAAMDELTQAILDIGLIETGQLRLRRRALSPVYLLAECLDRHRAQADHVGVRLELDVERDLPQVHADGPRLAQVVGNLVGNALRFTPAGGRIRVAAHRTSDDELAIAVADTGAGIPADDLPRVFDRFWRTQDSRHGAAGLGLAIARGIVEAHGGRIQVESTPGAGAIFSFVIPLIEPIAAAEPDSPPH